MTRLTKTSMLFGALALFAASPVSAVFDEAAAGDALIRRCSAFGPGDISMTARFEDRGAREKFTIEFEAAPGSGFQASQRIVFFVAGVRVGADNLERIVGGDLIGELDLDTQAGPGDDEKPFPSNFPTITQGTRVAIRSGEKLVLGCALR